MTARITLLVGLTFLVACNKTTFGGGSGSPGKKGNPEPAELHTDHEVYLTCGKDGALAGVNEVSGPSPYKVTVKGTFCGVPTPAADGAPTVMFLLDVSGSMMQNDPPTNGSCGRLAAAEAILASLGTESGANLGYVSFADYVEATQVPIPWTSFKGKLDAKIFCDMKGGATNYQAALARASEMLSTVSGPKVIYFISDGLPTRAGENPSNPITDGLVGSILIETIQKAGLSAASRLRNDLKDLFFYAIYLDGGDGGPNTEGDGIIASPKDYLAAVTGSADTVRLVDRAQDLAQVIMSFKPALKPAAGTAPAKLPEIFATLTGGRRVDLQSIKADPGSPDRVTFVTAPITLEGEPGKTTDNEVKVEMTLPDGTKKLQTVDLRFTPKST